MMTGDYLPEEEWEELDPIRQSGYRKQFEPWNMQIDSFTFEIEKWSYDIDEYIKIFTKGEAPSENSTYKPIYSDEVIFYSDRYGISRPGSSRPPPLITVTNCGIIEPWKRETRSHIEYFLLRILHARFVKGV